MKNLDFKIKKIAEIFDAKLIGNKEVKITGISDIENAKKGDITFSVSYTHLTLPTKRIV